jgi:extracellular elastinolytic metalloproteinase
MARQIDVRTPQDRIDPERRSVLHDAAEEVSASLAGEHRVEVASFDEATGNAAVVVSQGAEARQGDYVTRALRHLQRIGPALGLAAEQSPEYLADPDHQVTSAGAVAVHARQAYKSIPIYEAAETVRFDPEGRLIEVAGRSHTVAGDVPVAPTLTAEEALQAAARHVAEGGDGDGEATDPFGQPLEEPTLNLRDFEPVRRTAAEDRPDRVTTFDAPPFPHAVTVTLMWFPLDGALRLAWHTKLQVPGGALYRLLVDAADGRILLCRRLTRSLTGRAEVVLTAGQPRQAVTFPLPLDSYGAPVPSGLPDGFPDPWLLDGSTRGASVRAVLAEGSVPAQGTTEGDEVTFAAPPDLHHPDQLVVNLFALCGAMHDLLYLLGFREADGNFQVANLSRGGRAQDPVFARVHPGPVWGTANMATPPDGTQPVMNMGQVASTNRHTALDPDVVYHEYAHGLTNRLVGGPLDDASLDEVQSGGMGEGWGDFLACIIAGKVVVGDWVKNDPAGIRGFRYTDEFPDTFGDLGTGRYVDDRVHPIGEIWCATLMTLSRRLGAWTTAQIVVDALKLTAANPSFLAARDAILLAADQLAAARGDSAAERAELVHQAWEVFARYGMGPGARSNGATLTGIVADFTAPPRPTTAATVRAAASPELAIPDDDPEGVTSSVQLPDAGPIRELAVGVEIGHSYRGDLEVDLEAPDGRRVSLHQRAGGRASDLRETWRSADHEGLASLRGSPTAGTWVLHVADRARVDVGTLHAWSIEAEVAEVRPTVEAEAAPGLDIPDNDPKGIRSELVLAGEGTISVLTLTVDITHTFVGDLEVTLRGPDNRRVKVHRRGGGETDNLLETYSSEDGGPLAPFAGTAVAGTWTLLVADRAGRDVGKLNRWQLRAAL